MALVAYDDSDMENSDEEEGEQNRKTAEVEIITHAKPMTPPNKETDASLFSSLPLPKTDSRRIISEEEDDIFLHKKESPKDVVKPPKATVKITIPALSKISDNTPKLNIGRPEGKKATTRLLSMLPDPKFNQPSTSALNGQKFIPRTVNVTKPSVQKTKKVVPVAAKLTTYASDESDAEEGADSTQDFFSLHSSVDDTLAIEPDVQIPNVIKVQAASKIPEYIEPPPAIEQSNIPDGNDEVQGTSSGLQEDNEVPAQLDEEAIIKLCGIRGKHKKDFQIIDVDQKEILPDSREWLLKAITENTSQRASASKRRGDQPSNQQKRKHQITYLAHQAKANEQELQNQWANNRMSRKQTQSKYGF